MFVQARRIITREEDGLTAPWNCAGKSIWMNPPGGLRDGAGGRTRDASLTGLFWRRLAAHREEISHAIVIGFNIEILALSQRYSDFPASQLPLVIPRRRTKFWKYDKVGNLVEGKSPSHANVFIYVPGTIDCTDVFERSFSDLGAVTIPR